MDDEYINKVLSGDTNAFRYFLETYKDMAINVAVSIVKDDQYAEEIVQDTFMKAFNGLKSFNRTSKFKSWFYRILVNESFRKLRQMKRDFIILEEVQEVKVAPNKDIPDDKLEQIKKVMLVLPPNESLALNLFYLEEYSLRELGNITGWSTANTKVILHRARKNLRKLLENKNYN